MKILSLLLLALCWLGAGGGLHAQPSSPGEVWMIATRPEVRVPVYVVWNPQAVATVVLFSGGGGGYGALDSEGWPSNRNFLIRTGKVWASYPFNVVMVGRPTDGLDLHEGAVRVGEAHQADNDAVFAAIKRQSPLPLWVVGTSMGTLSAAAAAIRNTDNRIAGIVLSSSVTSYKITGAVPRQELGSIRVPVLVVHHARDACRVCAPYEAKNIPAALKNAPVKALVLITEGSGESGDPCEALHFHGYIGAEKSVVDLIARWIQHPVQ